MSRQPNVFAILAPESLLVAGNMVRRVLCSQQQVVIHRIDRYAVFVMFSVMLSVVWGPWVMAEAEGPGIIVSAWSRATPPGSSNGAIYGQIKNQSGRDVHLASVASPVAGHAMLHATVVRDGMSRMEDGEMALAANGSMVLRPGSGHIMLMGLEHPLVEGCQYPFELHWRGGVTTQHTFLTGSIGQLAQPDAIDTGDRVNGEADLRTGAGDKLCR